MDQGDFLEVLYDEFGGSGSQECGSFGMVVELARDGDYGVAAAVLKALIDDDHADLATELFRCICLGPEVSSVFNSFNVATACLLVGELLSDGADCQAAKLLNELVQDEQEYEDLDATIVISMMASRGHETDVVALCNRLFDVSSTSFAVLLGQMAECGFLPLASRVCLGVIQIAGGYDTKKFAEVQSKLLEAGTEGCLQLYQAMDSRCSLVPEVIDDLQSKISNACSIYQSDLGDIMLNNATVHSSPITA